MRYLKILEKLINTFDSEIFNRQNFMHYGIYGQISAKKNERDYTCCKIYNLHFCSEVSKFHFISFISRVLSRWYTLTQGISRLKCFPSCCENKLTLVRLKKGQENTPGRASG